MYRSNKERKSCEGCSDHELNQSGLDSLLQVHFFPKAVDLWVGAFHCTQGLRSHEFPDPMVEHSMLFLSGLHRWISSQHAKDWCKYRAGRWVGIAPRSLGFHPNIVKLVTQLGCWTQKAEVKQWEYFPIPVFPSVALYLRIYFTKSLFFIFKFKIRFWGFF